MYPYEYMDSFEKFLENKLPDRYDFFSSLKDGSSIKKMIVSLKKLTNHNWQKKLDKHRQHVNNHWIIYMLSMFGIP